MKACVLKAIGQLEYCEVPTPEPKAGEVLLRVHACGICSSDIPRIFTTGTYHFPTIPGHEFAGEVVALGPGTDESWMGRRAAVFPLLPCFKCPSCQAGEYARCDHYNYFGSRCDGGFAEYIAVPVWNLVPFADKLPFTAAALCEPTAVAKHCADAGHIRVGDCVAVIGTGTIGLLAALWAKAAGAAQVAVIGRSHEKLAFAQGLGICETVDSSHTDPAAAVAAMTDGRGADVCLECVGSGEAVGTAVVVAGKGGRVVLTGNPAGDITLAKAVYWQIMRKELTACGTWNSHYGGTRSDWTTALEYIQCGRIPVQKLITHTYPLKDIAKALDAVRARDVPTVKVMLTAMEEV